MNNDRIFEGIPNVAFHKITRQYGFFLGRPTLTWKQQRAALMNYTFYATNRN